jgi:hypothetical protein
MPAELGSVRPLPGGAFGEPIQINAVSSVNEILSRTIRLPASVGVRVDGSTRTNSPWLPIIGFDVLLLDA